jgi:hypothetical protein
LAPSKYHFISEYPAIKRCLTMIPQKASVAAQSALIPHIAKRKAIFMLPTTGQAEYILLHLQLNPWPMQTAQLQEFDTSLQCSAKYSRLLSSEYLSLYKKNGMETKPKSGDKK